MLSLQKLIDSIKADGAQCVTIFNNGTSNVVSQSSVRSFKTIEELECEYGVLNEKLKHRFDAVCIAVSEVYGVTVEDLFSLRRYEPIATAKHMARFLCNQICDKPTRFLSEYFGVDRTSIIKSAQTARDLLEVCVEDRCKLERIKAKAEVPQ